jgi:hypothetical protein
MIVHANQSIVQEVLSVFKSDELIRKEPSYPNWVRGASLWKCRQVPFVLTIEVSGTVLPYWYIPPKMTVGLVSTSGPLPRPVRDLLYWSSLIV